MTEYAFLQDLLSGIKARWEARPAPQDYKLPDDPTLQCVLERVAQPIRVR